MTRRLPDIDPYPQRTKPTMSEFDARVIGAVSRLRLPASLRRAWGGRLRFVRQVRREIARQEAGGEDWAAVAVGLRRGMLRRGAERRSKAGQSGNAIPPEVAVTLWATLCRACADVLGQTPFDVQIAAGYCLMCAEVAEMGTGEGKSLTAALGAAALGLAGRRVHVITVNDYLAARDAERFAPLFDALGLTSGCIGEDVDANLRRATYRNDIVFAAAKSIVFDYLRDRTGEGADRLTGGRAKLITLVAGPEEGLLGPLLPGLDAVIVDEADSVLIDQAATPFILSGGVANLGGLDPDTLMAALELARPLVEERHFLQAPALRRVTLTDAGRAALTEATHDVTGLLRVAAVREHLVVQGLVALHQLTEGRDYMRTDEGIAIIDENTGRVMPDRQWSQGLHQIVELKEGAPPSEIRATLGRITFQRFFPRYQHLCGMTGTARSAARELWEIYSLQVRRILPRRPDIRQWGPVRVFPDKGAKWEAIADHAARLVDQGAPVLIGTRTLGASRQMSAVLARHGIPHEVLSAEHAADEARVVAQAGGAGRVTVATNMAGRGTDILLDAPARAAGGLHVFLTELHENRRIDLQLSGRCGRQGDPGRVDQVLSLDDDLLKTEPEVVRHATRLLLTIGGERACHAMMRAIQALQTRRAERARVRMLRQDRQREKQLSLSGAPE